MTKSQWIFFAIICFSGSAIGLGTHLINSHPINTVVGAALLGFAFPAFIITALAMWASAISRGF